MSIAPEIADPPVLSPDDILDDYKRRLQLYADRDEWYAKLQDYYYGGSKGEGGLPILSSNAQGRPLLRPVGESIHARRTYSSQRLSPIVDDYASLVGRMPTVRVEPPDASEQGEQKAELLTKFLYSTFELSRMGYQQAQAGWYLSALGDSVYVLEPEPEELRVVWNVTSPRVCWPTFWHGYRRFEVFDLITAEVWTRQELRRQWGVTPETDGDRDCTVITYLSPHQRTVLVGTRVVQRVSHVEWDLGFCPAVWVFNKVTGQMGMSDIGQSLEQQDFLDFAFNVWADGIVHMTYPMIGIKNPLNIGQDAPMIGPGAPPVTLHGDGDIIVRNTQADPRALEQIISQTLQDINAATGSSQVRQEGQMKSSIVTGRAVQSVQGPQSTRIDFKQSVLGDAIRAANRMTLAMQEKAPVLSKFKGPIYGNYRGNSFVEEFDASKDIDGWYRTKVTWQQLVGMNLQQKVAVAYEGQMAKLWDDLEAREIIGVEDPIGMRKRISTQMLAEAELQGQMAQTQQQQMQPEQGQQGGQQQPQGARPAPLIFRPPQQGQQGPMQTGGPAAPGPTDKSGYVNALSKVAGKLKGTVWMAPNGTVLVSDHRDYAQVLEAVRALDPQTRVRAMPESKMPANASRLI